MRIVAVILFVFAALGFMVAGQNLTNGVNRPTELHEFAGYAVGTLLVPMVSLIVGLICWNKAAKPSPVARNSNANSP